MLKNRKILTILFINSTFFELETQNVRSTNKIVSRISTNNNKIIARYFFGQAMLRVCNFFAIRLRMLISFLNDVDIKLISELKNSLGKYHPVFHKNPFFGTPWTFTGSSSFISIIRYQKLMDCMGEVLILILFLRLKSYQIWWKINYVHKLIFENMLESLLFSICRIFVLENIIKQYSRLLVIVYK